MNLNQEFKLPDMTENDKIFFECVFFLSSSLCFSHTHINFAIAKNIIDNFQNKWVAFKHQITQYLVC